MEGVRTVTDEGAEIAVTATRAWHIDVQLWRDRWASGARAARGRRGAIGDRGTTHARPLLDWIAPRDVGGAIGALGVLSVTCTRGACFRWCECQTWCYRGEGIRRRVPQRGGRLTAYSAAKPVVDDVGACALAGRWGRVEYACCACPSFAEHVEVGRSCVAAIAIATMRAQARDRFEYLCGVSCDREGTFCQHSGIWAAKAASEREREAGGGCKSVVLTIFA